MSVRALVSSRPFLAAAGVPLALRGVQVASTQAGAGGQNDADAVRQLTGIGALLAGGLFLATGSTVAKEVALGAAASWGVIRIGVL